MFLNKMDKMFSTTYEVENLQLYPNARELTLRHWGQHPLRLLTQPEWHVNNEISIEIITME